MRTPFLLMLFCFSTALCAQTPEAAMDSLATRHFQEKIVLSFLKSQYVAGETVSFKAHVLNGYQLSLNSTNLYAELYDNKKVLLDKQIIPLINGSGEGSFVLPASLPEGIYYLRAYTTYMLNYDAAFQFVRLLAVYNPASPVKLQARQPEWNVVARPEGGTLLAGEATRVGVRLVSSTALPETWTAALYETGNAQPLAEAEVYSREAGAFSFAPEAGKTYFVRVKDAKGTVKEAALPAAKTEGTQLQLGVAGNKVAYQFVTKNLPSNGAGYKLLATLYDQVVFSATIKNSTGAVTGFVDIANLPSGVLRFTVFNTANEPVNERLCFLHQAIKKTTPKLSFDTVAFTAKALNHWQLQADTMQSSYAVQVQSGAAAGEDDFLAQLYLHSDFTTPIHEATAYLTNPGADQKKALDALLLTESWQRFSWRDVMAGRFPALQYQPENYLTFTGIVRKGKQLQPLRDINMLLRPMGDSVNTMVVDTKTDSTGTLRISDALFEDTIRVFYQAVSRKVFERDITLDFTLENKFHAFTGEFPASPFETVSRKPGDAAPAFVAKTLAQLQAEKDLQRQSQMMEEIVVRSKVKNATAELEKKYSSPLLGSINAVVFDLVNKSEPSLANYTNVLQWLVGRVSGMTIQRVGGRLQVQLRGIRSLLGNSAAQIFVDDMPVDADYLDGFPASNIALVKVIKGASLAGPNGAVAIYTKRGGEGGSNTTSANMPTTKIVGYRKPIPLYAPDYSITNFKQLPDQRDVLFNAFTFAEGEGAQSNAIRFYNNDAARSFVVTVIGFGADGKPVYERRLVQAGKGF